jgi:hypothetical protein
MNLFILSADPKEAAKAHADKHVVKMILEACQMLYSAHWVAAYPELLNNKSAVAVSRAQKLLSIPPSMLTAPKMKNAVDQGYRTVHLHHPCTKWIRATKANYEWAAHLAAAIGEEYGFRYCKKHSCAEHVQWLLNNKPSIPDLPLQTFAIAMKPEYKISEDPIECYRHYYRTSKEERGLLQYTKRERPIFI